MDQPVQPAPQIDQRVYELYDEYCHGFIDRREFLARARAIVIGGVSALAMAQLLFPRYAEAQTISFTDARIKAKYVDYPSPGGNSGKMRGYLVQPTGNGPFPAVLVVHENRGPESLHRGCGAPPGGGRLPGAGTGWTVARGWLSGQR